MAEVLGIVASIIAVLQLNRKVTSMSYHYITGVKRAPKDLRELMEELHSLGQVLISLQDYTSKTLQSEALQKLNGQDGPLRGCVQELESLMRKMETKDTDGFKVLLNVAIKREGYRRNHFPD